jgi:glycosyltransferase involved in cell wall biosynthesis
VLPLISVIMATLNRRDLVARALDSVRAQGMGTSVESLVIDGVSTDGTLEMLAKRDDVRVLSEPDRNVYEAWNKGVRLARGRIICFLNSDDLLPQGTLQRVASAFAADPDLEMLSGAVELRPLAPNSGAVRIIDAAPILALREQDIGPGVPITNGRFLSRRLLDRVGAFDERWRLVSDRDWLLRAILGKAQNSVTQTCLYSYGLHGGSLTFSGEAQRKLAKESLGCATAGLLEARTSTTRAAYARWHAWALAYQAALERDHPMTALKYLWAGTRVDPYWWVRLPMPLWRHVKERSWRLGRVVTA